MQVVDAILGNSGCTLSFDASTKGEVHITLKDVSALDNAYHIITTL
jgi:hypothetical protein